MKKTNTNTADWEKITTKNRDNIAFVILQIVLRIMIRF